MKSASSPKDTALDDLRARILKLDLKPGAVLEETPLCQRYGLSRTPLREVLQRLAGEGFLTLSAGRGAEVAQIELSRLRQFFQSAAMLHASIAKLAAAEIDSTGIDRMKAAQLAMVKARVSRNAAGMALADYHVHAEICDLSANPYLGPALKRLMIDQTRMSVGYFANASSTDAARIEQTLAEHEHMIDAIAKGQQTRALALAVTHWESMRHYIEARVAPVPLTDETGFLDED